MPKLFCAALAIGLFVLSQEARAGLLFNGNGSTPPPPSGCIYTGPTTDRSCVQSTDFTSYLQQTNVDGSHLFAFFTSNSGGICSANLTIQCFNLAFAPPPSAPWVGFGYATQAKLCNGQQTASTNFVDVLYASFPGYGPLWFMGYSTGGSILYYQVGPDCNTAPLGFVNHTTAGVYASIGDLCQGSGILGSNASINNGDQLEAPSMPSGVPYWTSFGYVGGFNCKIVNSGVTLTLNPGSKFFGGICDGGAGGELCINAPNVTVNGAGATVGYNNGGNNVINVLADVGLNPTFKGAPGNPLVMDCQALYGQALAGRGQDGFQTGRRVGMVTVSDMFIQNCGGQATASHSVYLGWGPSGAVPSDPTYCHNFLRVTVKDSTGDSPAVKFDDTCGNQRGLAVNLAVYSTIEGNPNTNSDENQAYDNQCGGWHLLKDSYLEMYGQQGGNDQWVFAKLMWGPLGSLGCQNTPALKDDIRFDGIIVAFDGYADIVNAYHGQLLVACGSARDGNDCNANAPGHIPVCVTNSQIVGDYVPARPGQNSPPLIMGTGVFTDANCTGTGPDTNTYYSTANGVGGRAAVCSQPNWVAGAATHCAWPFVPAFLTVENYPHDKQIETAHAAGFCGEGTMMDPIRECVAPLMAYMVAP